MSRHHTRFGNFPAGSPSLLLNLSPLEPLGRLSTSSIRRVIEPVERRTETDATPAQYDSALFAPSGIKPGERELREPY